MSRSKVCENIWEYRTRSCCKSLGRLVIRSERPIKLSDSWFFSKYMQVQHKTLVIRGRALFRLGRLIPLLNLGKLRMLIIQFCSQTLGAKVHSQEGNSPDYQLRPLKGILSQKESKKVLIIRRQAWNQPFFKKCVIAY